MLVEIVNKGYNQADPVECKHEKIISWLSIEHSYNKSAIDAQVHFYAKPFLEMNVHNNVLSQILCQHFSLTASDGKRLNISKLSVTSKTIN